MVKVFVARVVVTANIHTYIHMSIYLHIYIYTHLSGLLACLLRAKVTPSLSLSCCALSGLFVV